MIRVSTPLRLTAALLLTAPLAACSAGADPDTLDVLASSTPHAEILEWVDEQHDDISLDIKIVTGGPEANAAVANGSVDVNYFQHEPYLLDWENQTGQDVEILAPVHIEPMSLYSTAHDSIDDIPDGSTVALPRSGSNFARGLLLLADHGLITLDAEADPAALSQITLTSVVDNPKNLELVPVEDELAARSLDDPSIAAAVINSNFAMEAGLDLDADTLITERPEGNPYANILVASAEGKDDPRVATLVDAVTSTATADWIREKYGHAVIPVN